MTKQEEKELDKAVQLLGDEAYAEEYDQNFVDMIERLCAMSRKDYRQFMRYMRYERRARKHLGSMSFDA